MFMAESTPKVTDESINQLSDTSLADTISLMMNNAVASQQAMKTVTNTSVSSVCLLILKEGK